MFVTDAYGQETEPAVDGGHGADAPADTHAGTEVPHDAGHGEGAFPPFDPSTFPSQILWLAITFGLFYLFLKRVIVPRLGAIMDVRENRIAQDIEHAGKLNWPKRAPTPIRSDRRQGTTERPRPTPSANPSRKASSRSSRKPRAAWPRSRTRP
jgi:F-type H+-transporting ATPase subunit b